MKGNWRNHIEGRGRICPVFQKQDNAPTVPSMAPISFWPMTLPERRVNVGAASSFISTSKLFADWWGVHDHGEDQSPDILAQFVAVT
jgi:hypothetical protein